ncbi:MAG: cell wall metabolism sensor histidine kinase WalK [Cellulosilyticum sp.]|nr:cell wall metabolism sensor histidine kinase WalK [Cellulosilyticum sp.]
MKWFHSLRWQLFILIFLISYIPLMFYSSVLLERMEAEYLSQTERTWVTQANMIAMQIREENYLVDSSNASLFKSLINTKSTDTSCRIMVVDASGFVVVDSSNADMGKTLMNHAVLGALNNSSTTEKSDEYTALTVAVPVMDKEKKAVVGAVVMVPSLEGAFTPIEDLQDQVNILTLLIALISGLLSFITSSFITKPLKTLMRFVQKITNGQLDQKVDVVGNGEIAELGNAFNHMTQQLQRVEQSREEFVSNVSHELKTPLSSIKVLTESLMFQEDVPVELYKEFFEDINSEVDRLNSIISDLLTLVRLDQREIPLNITQINLGDLIQGILKRLAPLAKKKSINLVYEGQREIIAEIDTVKFSLALTNLVENAIKYTPEGGNVNVMLQGDLQDALIIVEDSGIGIAKEEQSKIFERFYRTDKTRNRATGGTGLGLAITYKTVVMHNGSIVVESEEGKGSTFSVQIPLRHVWEGGTKL